MRPSPTVTKGPGAEGRVLGHSQVRESTDGTGSAETESDAKLTGRPRAWLAA